MRFWVVAISTAHRRSPILVVVLIHQDLQLHKSGNQQGLPAKMPAVLVVNHSDAQAAINNYISGYESCI
jgi:hypothetical protein